MSDDEEIGATGFEGMEEKPVPVAGANGGFEGVFADDGEGGAASGPPGYSSGPQTGSFGSFGGAVYNQHLANERPALFSEDIRQPEPADGSARPSKYLTELGRGEHGGKTGGIPGKKTSVNDVRSEARSTLVTHQPGRPRSDSQYVPYNTPKTSNAVGHTLFAIDIPKAAGKDGKVFGKTASRIVINRNEGKGAQICIESYEQGTEAIKGHTDKETGQFIHPDAKAAICKEVVSISSFNVSEIQRVNTKLFTLSTLSQEKITIVSTTTVGETLYDPGCCIVCNPPCLIFGAGCCQPCADPKKGEVCADSPCACGQPGKKSPCDEKSGCQENCCFAFDCCGCYSENCCWVPKKLDDSTDVKEENVPDPFDIVNVTDLQFILKGSVSKDEADELKFIWRVQSVGETETDLKYDIAPELLKTCVDPTSTARTLANVIHYLNA